MNQEIFAFRADYHPVLAKLMDQMGLVETINTTLREEADDVLVDTGTVVAAMIHNLLGEGAIRLYRLSSFFADKPLPLLFPWSAQLDPSQLNDDRAGRALDTLWAAGPQKVFSAVSQQVIKRYALDLKAVHADTTSRSFCGAYDDQDAAVPQITYGYSKDHRPDLKQILFGVGTSRDGVPVVAEVCSGNQSDMTWNTRWIKAVRDQVGLSADTPLVYVADSALVTSGNLDVLADARIDFITRLPERFGIAEDLMEAALSRRKDWLQVGTMAAGEKAATYQLWETEQELNGRVYRFVVVHSSSLDERRLRALERHVAKEGALLEDALTDIRQQEFVCAPDAERAWARFLVQHAPAWHTLTAQVKGHEQKVKRARPGCPRKNEQPQVETVYRPGAQMERDAERYQQERDKCGMFVLMSSLRHREEWSGREILAEYKGQTGVERIFRFIKNPAWVGAFCLKEPERIAAFGYVVLLAAMVYTLLERQVRRALAEPREAPVEGLNRQLTRRPTSYAIQMALTPILVIGQRRRGQLELRPSGALSQNQHRLLRLAGFDDGVYYWRGKMPPLNPIYQTG
ncbi:MAG: IS1634 family transposase [Chloroflexota bacterium]|nr:MAG: IS1634 family transposase [Chloroflexota bacterium]